MHKRILSITFVTVLAVTVLACSSPQKQVAKDAAEEIQENVVIKEPRPIKITGKYNVTGKTGDKVTYRGTVIITGQDNTYTLKMVIGRAIYMGKGKRNDENLTVTWKSGVWEYRIDNDTGIITGSRENKSEIFRPLVPPGKEEPARPADGGGGQ